MSPTLLFIVTDGFAIRNRAEYHNERMSLPARIFLVCMSFFLGHCTTSSPILRGPKEQGYYELGLNAFQEERFPDAIGYLEKALELNSADADSRLILGLSLLGIGRGTEAEKQVSSACRQRLEWANCWDNLSYVYIKNKKFELAVESADRALKIKTYNSAHLAYINRAQALFEMGHVDDSLKSLERAKTLAPDHCPIHIHIARALILKKQTADALLEIRFALSKCPQDPLVHLWEAFGLFQNKELRKTHQKLRYIRQRFPKGLAMEQATRYSELLKDEIPLPEPPLD